MRMERRFRNEVEAGGQKDKSGTAGHMILSFVSPRLLMIGGGSVARLDEVLGELGLSRPLVVTDPWMVSSGMVDKAVGRSALRD
jgi:hypothetical protein